MQMKYLFLVITVIFAMGAACQKEVVPTVNVDETKPANNTEEVVQACSGSPAECFEKCSVLSVSLEKENCYVSILNEQTKEFCGQVGDAALCNDYFVWQSSMNAVDCSQIASELWKTRCLEAFADTQILFNQADFDGDGLTNQEEYELGTDFRKADTDGDGYSDYEEVKAGYDPLTAN
jgi:hypothetical protein